MRYDDDGTFTARMPNGERVRLRVKRDIEKLNDLDPSERLMVMLKMFPNPKRGRSFNDVMKDLADRDARVGGFEDVREGDDDGGVSNYHHASKVADLLVEAGSHPDRAAALHHLLHKPSGQALLARMHKAAETEKESSMSTSEHLDAIMKRFGPVQFAKHIVETGRSPVGEHELVAALTKAASEQHPELSSAQAFAKLYTEESVWRACAIAKAMPFVADLTPLVVGGVDAVHEAVDDTESSEAYAQLKELGARKWPTASEAQQFANAFTDPANATLAQKAHRRPTPPMGGAYPFPR
jgi:hypothetical protein